jgi:hypothetical protein
MSDGAGGALQRSERRRRNPVNDAVEVVVKAQYAIDVVAATERNGGRICETQRLVVVLLEHLDSVLEHGCGHAK